MDHSAVPRRRCNSTRMSQPAQPASSATASPTKPTTITASVATITTTIAPTYPRSPEVVESFSKVCCSLVRASWTFTNIVTKVSFHVSTTPSVSHLGLVVLLPLGAQETMRLAQDLRSRGAMFTFGPKLPANGAGSVHTFFLATPCALRSRPFVMEVQEV